MTHGQGVGLGYHFAQSQQRKDEGNDVLNVLERRCLTLLCKDVQQSADAGKADLIRGVLRLVVGPGHHVIHVGDHVTHQRRHQKPVRGYREQNGH